MRHVGRDLIAQHQETSIQIKINTTQKNITRLGYEHETLLSKEFLNFLLLVKSSKYDPNNKKTTKFSSAKNCFFIETKL